MLQWGVILMLIGAVSFALPIFGRQFILISAVGLTGVGPSIAGAVLFIFGLILFIAGRKAETKTFEAYLNEVVREAEAKGVDKQITETQDSVREQLYKGRRFDLDRTYTAVLEQLESGATLHRALRVALPGVMPQFISLLASRIEADLNMRMPREKSIRAALADLHVKDSSD